VDVSFFQYLKQSVLGVNFFQTIISIFVDLVGIEYETFCIGQHLTSI
jgi:hypothetical protein